MSLVPLDAELEPTQFAHPILWFSDPAVDVSGFDTSDATLDHYLGEGTGVAIKSFGHDPQTGVHFLLTRSGTGVHTDKAYLRFSHQLILRNDGNRVRGLPRYDTPDSWHPPMRPGTLYCLDTHSPHQGLADDRFPNRAQIGNRAMKAVLSVDRNTPLDPKDALALLLTYVQPVPRQFSEFEFDPKAKFLKWKEPTRK